MEKKKKKSKTKKQVKKVKKSDPSLVRLNKFIADSGITSRRKADELIDNGQVRVNGKTVHELGIRVNPFKDVVTVKGKKINPIQKKIYYILNKPQNVLTSMSDPEGRPTVADYFDTKRERVFPVGRLDWDSEGLLIMTNDGEFAQKVTHPKEEIPKTYLVKVDGSPTEEHLLKLRRGVSIVGGKVRAKHIEKIKRGSSRKYQWLKIVITEGKNRQIRRMFEKIGFDVLKLQRVAIGHLSLGSLKKGVVKSLKPTDLKKVFSKSVKN